jgi:hypothetical protein
MNLASIKVNALLSSAMFTAGTEVVTSEINVVPSVIAQSNLPSISLEKFGFSFSTSGTAVEAVASQRWSTEKAQRFKDLSRIEALGVLTVKELAELETLTRLRRSAMYPRTADEILWHRGQNSVTNGLVQAIQQYVKFHATNHS